MKKILLGLILLLLTTSVVYSQQLVQPLQLTVKPEKQVSGIGEIVIISGEIKNVSNQDIFIYSLEQSLTVTYDVIDAKGNKIDVPLPIIDLWTPEKNDFVLLKSGKSLPKTFKFSIPREIIKSGLYTISVKYDIWKKGYYEEGKLIDLGAWTGTLTSNPITINVVEKKDVVEGNRCKSDNDCLEIDCSKYNKGGLKEGFKQYCVNNKCKCMCYGCE